jgi:hypothetical protein
LLRRVNHPRFEFKRAKDEDVDGHSCRVLVYREKEIPTLVGTVNSGNIFLYGRIWLDQADGRIWRTELRFDRGSERRSYIRVDFRASENLTILVPARMWEWYESADQLGRIGGDKTIIQGLATYNRIRRFQVTTAEEIK